MSCPSSTRRHIGGRVVSRLPSSGVHIRSIRHGGRDDEPESDRQVFTKSRYESAAALRRRRARCRRSRYRPASIAGTAYNAMAKALSWPVTSSSIPILKMTWIRLITARVPQTITMNHASPPVIRRRGPSTGRDVVMGLTVSKRNTARSGRACSGHGHLHAVGFDRRPYRCYGLTIRPTVDSTPDRRGGGRQR